MKEQTLNTSNERMDIIRTIDNESTSLQCRITGKEIEVRAKYVLLLIIINKFLTGSLNSESMMQSTKFLNVGIPVIYRIIAGKQFL